MVRITNDDCVSHLDPNIIAQPNATPEKVKSMWETAVGKASEPYHNWKSDSGIHEPDFSNFPEVPDSVKSNKCGNGNTSSCRGCTCKS